MRTPEEIEMALSVCTDGDFCCSKCPYTAKSQIHGYYGGECMDELLVDTIAYIKQLKIENMKLKQRLNALYGETDDTSCLEKLVCKAGPITISNPNVKNGSPKEYICVTMNAGNPIYINISSIDAVSEWDGKTHIVSGTLEYSVKETVEEVMDKIKEA